MKKWLLILVVINLLILSAVNAWAQKSTKGPAPAKPIVFAVLNDGAMLEPIAFVANRKLSAPVNGSDARSAITAFNRTYYKPGAQYKLVFGGVNGGTISVKGSDASSDCAKNMATVTTKASKTPLRGLVMGLATNAAVKTSTGVRRRPTAAEKDAIEVLVRAEYAKEKLTAKDLRFQNLTAIDVDNDGAIEFVGSYWVEIDKLTRGLLFFIGDIPANGKARLGHSEYRLVDQASVMSGEIKSVDEGVYHEVLLDSFDYDADGTNEIFTYVQSFEGAGFNAYKRNAGKWKKEYEFSNYHCGF